MTMPPAPTRPAPTPWAVAEYAALIAYIHDIHAPQDNLTEKQWQAAQQWLATYTGPTSIEEKVTFDAVAVMVHDLPVLGWTPEEETAALRLIAAHDQAWAGSAVKS
ncbi:hypothetical protein ACFYUR_19010 [Micromonospora haikouensis]|uniref:hypothetical protein n=1 Tax=Micromonospora haikouensis TaxID=686309 RepID=UPI0036B71087